MEFSFNINELFREEISVINDRLETSAGKNENSRRIKTNIGHVIDRIGEASAFAQKLQAPITSKEKLIDSNNRIYLKKVASENGGKVIVVGFLKIGTKKLFLFDERGIYHELEPMCVLDFYVHESMQRQGCGKQLFEFMLKNEKIDPHHLAINRPSQKFVSFLARHYNLKATIPQINNFVVFKNFFHGRELPVDKRQWSYNSESDMLKKFPSHLVPSRQHSLDRHQQSQVPKLPNINLRQVERDHSGSYPAYLNEANSQNLTAEKPKKPSESKNFPNNFSTETSSSSHLKDLSQKMISQEKDRLSRQCTSLSQLNPRLEDTSFNIFGVSGSSSKCQKPVERRSAFVRKQETIFW